VVLASLGALELPGEALREQAGVVSTKARPRVEQRKKRERMIPSGDTNSQFNWMRIDMAMDHE